VPNDGTMSVGDLFVLKSQINKLYTYDGTTWDLGVVLPTEEPTENLEDGNQWFDKGYIYTLKEYNGNN